MKLLLPETKWTSSDESIATVSEDGTVTGVMPGTADITAELCFYGNESGMTVTKQITVVERVLSAPKINKPVAGKQAITVKWKKTDDQITGYRIQYSLKKNFKGAKTITLKKPAKISKKITGLKSGKTYYVRICTFDDSGSAELTSDWSTIKKVKTK